ncbi:MAG: FAD:protein FMN transferase [Paludibacter sp.]
MQYFHKILPGNIKLFYAWFSAMFTRVDLMIYDDATREDFEVIANKIEIEIARIELFSNRFDETSELSNINKNAYANEINVSDELFKIISDCQLYNALTLGYFDITINSFNHFAEGAKSIQLDKQKQTIKFLHPDVQLDLSGFIKGYALQSVHEMLKAVNIDNALINIGNSSILALGNHPNGVGWKVSSSEIKTANECVLLNQCLTTSGNNEKTKWPIIHPQTGEIIVKSKPVSVITTDCSIGEILSTVLYIANKNEKEIIFNKFEAIEIDW